MEEQPLSRHRSQHMFSGSVESAKDVVVVEDSSPSSLGWHAMGNHPQNNGNAFQSDEVTYEILLLIILTMQLPCCSLSPMVCHKHSPQINLFLFKYLCFFPKL